MSGHTPGPWHVREGEYGNLLVECDYKRMTFVLAVCEPHETEDDAARLVREANARLIAAAPDLLEALKSQTCPQCLPSEPDEDVCDQCRKRRAAIAKAGGK